MSEDAPFYIYSPVDKAVNPAVDPALESQPEISDADKDLLFPALLSGREDEEHRRERKEIFHSSWNQTAQIVQDYIARARQNTIAALVAWIDGRQQSNTSDAGLPVALLHAEFGGGVDFGSIEQAISRHRPDREVVIVSNPFLQAVTLKASLKRINTVVARHYSASQVDSSIYLPYDLAWTHDVVQTCTKPSIIVITIPNAEVLDSSLVADLLDLLSVWNQRVRFCVIIGMIALEGRLENLFPPKLLSCLDICSFEMQSIDANDLIAAVYSPAARVHASGTSIKQVPRFWLGPSTVKSILQQATSCFSSPQWIQSALKYVHMSHSFANPLSSLLDRHNASLPISRDMIDVVRNLPSFRSFCEQLLKDNRDVDVRQMLYENDAFSSILDVELRRCHQRFEMICVAIDVTMHLSGATSSSWTSLYCLAMQGRLLESDELSSAIDRVQRLDSTELQILLDNIESLDLPHDDFKRFVGELLRIRATFPQIQNTRIRNPTALSTSSLTTKVVAQRVELTQSEMQLSSQEHMYAEYLKATIHAIEGFLSTNLRSPTDIFLHEVFLCDPNWSLKAALAPRPRTSIERGLSNPSHYLFLPGSSSQNQGPTPSWPIIALVYQLHLEAGTIIDVNDMWMAFRTLMSSDEAETDEQNLQQHMALFARALAEFKYLGLIKQNAKKPDHYTRMFFQGL